MPSNFIDAILAQRRGEYGYEFVVDGQRYVTKKIDGGRPMLTDDEIRAIHDRAATLGWLDVALKPDMIRELATRLLEAEARVKVLEEALQWIGDAHTPDQPATSPLTELEWTLSHVMNLRGQARTALQEQNR
jgi:hypothetical protein